MCAFQYYEGTKDYIAATPALILTFRASGSVTGGQFVAFDAGNTGDVYTPAVASGSVAPAGFALMTKATLTEVPVLVWGFAKNVPWLGATSVAGNPVFISGSSATTSAGLGIYVCGKVITGSAAAGTVVALIDCMNVVRS
jgi:hypothetical protein